MWQVVSQQVASCACFLIYHEVVNGMIYQLSITRITPQLPKVMQRRAISITNAGPRMTMKPKYNLALLWRNSLYINGERMQILCEMNKKYINTFLTMHCEYVESEVQG